MVSVCTFTETDYIVVSCCLPRLQINLHIYGICSLQIQFWCFIIIYVDTTIYMHIHNYLHAYPKRMCAYKYIYVYIYIYIYNHTKSLYLYIIYIYNLFWSHISPCFICNLYLSRAALRASLSMSCVELSSDGPLIQVKL